MAGADLVPFGRAGRGVVLAEHTRPRLALAATEQRVGRDVGELGALAGGIGDRHRLQEVPRIGMRRAVVDVVGIAELDRRALDCTDVEGAGSAL